MLDNKTVLKQQTRRLAQWAGAMGMCGWLVACTGPTARPGVEVKAQDIDFLPDSLEVQPFSANQRNYGAKLTALVKTGIANEKYLKVVEHGGQTILSGTLTIGRVNTNSHCKPYEIEDKDGKKVTKYTCYYRKQFTSQATYSLSKGGKVIAGNNFTDNYDSEWHGETAAEARTKAISDENILTNSLNTLARQIVSAVSPHQETWSFPLATGVAWQFWKRHPSLKLGIQYYKSRRYDQAEKYWNQAIKQAVEPQDKAAAHYNIGVLRVHEGKYANAFRLFKKADELDPGNYLYMRALTKAEEAGWNQKIITAMGARKSSTRPPVQRRHAGTQKYRLTVNATPRESKIRILGIKPKYRPGIALKPGKFTIEVTHPGYHKKIKPVIIKNADLLVDIELRRK